MKLHGAPQLINNQKEELFDSHKKMLPEEQNSSNQPNQSQSQSVIDQGNLITRKACFVVKGETSRSQEIDVKSFHEELCAS